MFFKWSVLFFFPLITRRKYLWSLWSDYPSDFCSDFNPGSYLKLYHLNVAFSRKGNFCVIRMKGSTVLKVETPSPTLLTLFVCFQKEILLGDKLACWKVIHKFPCSIVRTGAGLSAVQPTPSRAFLQPPSSCASLMAPSNRAGTCLLFSIQMHYLRGCSERQSIPFFPPIYLPLRMPHRIWGGWGTVEEVAVSTALCVHLRLPAGPGCWVSQAELPRLINRSFKKAHLSLSLVILSRKRGKSRKYEKSISVWESSSAMP